MKLEKIALWVKYLICFGAASLISVAVFGIEGFFTDDLAVNLQILADGFMVSGALFLLFAGLIFVSSQGALIGIGFIMRNVILTWFVPLGRKKQELYGDYRERKIAEIKKNNTPAIWVVGLVFFAVGIGFMIAWWKVTGYQMPQ